MERIVPDPVPTEVEEALRQAFLHERTITFLALADRFPEYPWNSLFKALNRLQQQRFVRMTLSAQGCEIFIPPESRLNAKPESPRKNR